MLIICAWMDCLFIISFPHFFDASSLNIGNEYFQKLAVDDFNICQSMHIEELKHLERCVSLCILVGCCQSGNYYNYY